MSTLLCFYTFRQTFRDIDDSRSLSIHKEFLGFIHRIDCSHHLNVCTCGKKIPNRTANRAVIIIDDIDWNISDDTGVINSNQKHGCKDDDDGHTQEFRTSDNCR